MPRCMAEHRLHWVDPQPPASLTAQLRGMAQPDFLRGLVSAVLPKASTAANQPPTVMFPSQVVWNPSAWPCSKPVLLLYPVVPQSLYTAAGIMYI